MPTTSFIFLKKGYLVQPDLINFVNGIDPELVLDLLKDLNAPKIVSLSFFKKNKESILHLINKYITNGKFEKTVIISLKNKVEAIDGEKKEEREIKERFKEGYEEIFDVKDLITPKKVDVKDFVSFFKSRFNYFKEILKSRKELNNLTSIDKLPKSNQNISIIGMVLEKRETKNKNIIITLEDGKGITNVLINRNRVDVYNKALSLVEDEVIAVKGFGNREIIFASDILFPEILNDKNKKIKEDKNLLFISDVHVGSEKFLEANFRKFIKWVNCEIGNETQKARAKKVSHIFIVGDLVDGVGIYPTQEEELSIKDIREQYKAAAELFDEIRKDIKIIFIPGNHDAVRLVEPQFFNDYAKPLQKLENATLLPNPSYYNVYGYRVLLYHGYSLDYYANNVYALKQLKPYENPEVLLKFLLTKRHLAPVHGSTLYMPTEEDFFVIKKIPDIFVTSHVHKTGTSWYRGILLISTSCWQARTPFQEKVGHIPDPCKVPIFNTKTKRINILDFS